MRTSLPVGMASCTHRLLWLTDDIGRIQAAWIAACTKCWSFSLHLLSELTRRGIRTEGGCDLGVFCDNRTWNSLYRYPRVISRILLRWAAALLHLAASPGWSVLVRKRRLVGAIAKIAVEPIDNAVFIVNRIAPSRNNMPFAKIP